VLHLYQPFPLTSGSPLQPHTCLQSVQTIDGDITLRNLDGMTSLNGLGSLQATNGEVLMYGMPRLASTRALTNLTSIGESY
jgi:hypothetical protein